MARTKTSVPHPFPFLETFAALYGQERSMWSDQREKTIRSLSLNDLKALSEVYETIRKQNCSAALSAWIDETNDPRGRQAFLLLFLFQELGERGITPFNDGEVRYTDARKDDVDYSIIPDTLHYLIEPARKYGSIRFDEDIATFVAGASKSEITELCEIARRATQKIDAKMLDEVIDKFPITASVASERVYFTVELALRVLEATGHKAGRRQ